MEAKWALNYVAVATTAVVCYLNSLHCGFVFDDISAVVDNKDVIQDTPLKNLLTNDFWGTPIKQDRSHKSYRPICVLTFRLNYVLGGLDPLGYHLGNILLHAAVCVLFMRVSRLVFMEDMLRCRIAAFVFAVHPIHTEAVTGVVGRAELLAAIFALLAFIAYDASIRKPCKVDESSACGYRGFLLCCLMSACVFCATFSKEQGITIIGVCATYELFLVQKVDVSKLSSLLQTKLQLRRGVWSTGRGITVRFAFLLLTAAAVLSARFYVMGSELPVFVQFDNPAAASPSPSRQLTYNYLLPVNAWLLLNPCQLCCDWTMDTIPLVTSMSDPRNFATIAFYLVAVRLFHVTFFSATSEQRRRSLVMALAFTLMPFLPASNLFFPVGFVIAERILYMPSMGYCILLAEGLASLRSRLPPRSAAARRAVTCAVLAMVVLFACKTVIRNYDWRTERSLFMAGLRVTTENAKLYNNVGHTYEAERRFPEALAYFQAAARKQPNDIGSHLNVGRTLVNLHEPIAAEKAYRMALSLMPAVRRGQAYSARVPTSHLNVYLGLASLLSQNESRLLEADALYRSAISMRPDFTQAYMNRGDLLLRLHQPAEAAKQYWLALDHGASNADDVHYNLGVVYLSTGSQAEALEHFDKAISINPHHKLALYNSAALIQESGSHASRRQEAMSRIALVQQLDPANEKAYFTHALLATDVGDYALAKSKFLKAIELKRDFKGALFNLALLLANNMQLQLEAKPYLEECLRYHPDHIKSMLLLGDINLMHMNDSIAAEKNFRAILAIEPEHVQAKHNLCVVLVQRTDLPAAERCLSALLQQVPGEHYVVQHLAIVQARLKQTARVLAGPVTATSTPARL